MFNIKNVKFAAIVSVALTSVACSSDITSSKVNQTAMSSESSKAASAWVTTQQKHNNSGISMRYQLNGELAVGKPVTASLEFSGATAADAVVIMKPAAGLTVSTSEGVQKGSDAYLLPLPANAVTARTVSFTPNAEGEYFISFQLRQNGQASMTGIMLRVGDKGLAKAKRDNVVTTESGEKLIVMPAK